ncbi:hypothetical protein HK100_003837 [Physocladia obscura]|uniref:Alkaline phosphatase n=1 Tax=Physocladia obscura TaxID=109957 RepID=A0AAD5T885_9FUNG|nr:hypothetical protein HK100_003837 [Physocladia obscura]
MSSTALLGNNQNDEDYSYGAFVAKQLGLNRKGGLLRFFATTSGVAALLLFVYAVVEYVTPVPLNVIMLVSDGFGPASETLGRNFLQHIENLPPSAVLPLDTILVGSSRTRSSDSFVTDSAAGATAFSCALKSYNGAIGVDPDMNPCGTVLEAAKLRGYMTGIVATSRITHATPASFSSHVIDRDMENEIAVQQIGNYSLGRMIDVAFAGGSCQFQPKSAGSGVSCRSDELDLFSWGAEKIGWNYVKNVAEFRSIDVKSPRLPLMGLFTPDHLSYEIDRDPTREPSLKEMAIKALNILSTATKKSRMGFFIMIEGSRIDMAAHVNDPAAHVREILAYNEAIEAIIEWVDNHSNTIMVSTSDHETGGLSVAHQLGDGYPVYEWFPSILVPVQNSTEILGKYLSTYPIDSSQPSYATFITDTLLPLWLGITDATPSEIAFLQIPKLAAGIYQNYLAEMVSDRAGLGWTTHGHSAVDVNLYAHGHRANELRGNHENTDIGKFLESALGVDLKSVTAKLTTNKSWWNELTIKGKILKADKAGNAAKSEFDLMHFHGNIGH